MNDQEQQKVIDLINSNQVVIMPTDTIYGVVGKALDHDVVEKIYDVKGREESKPFVILISDYAQLESLGIALKPTDQKFLKSVWPGPASVVIPSKAPQYLHRGKSSLAIRMPEPNWLRDIVKSTGPIIATSANLSHQEYIHDLDKINELFAEKVDYISRQDIDISKPSRIINLANRSILR